MFEVDVPAPCSTFFLTCISYSAERTRLEETTIVLLIHLETFEPVWLIFPSMVWYANAAL